MSINFVCGLFRINRNLLQQMNKVSITEIFMLGCEVLSV